MKSKCPPSGTKPKEPLVNATAMINGFEDMDADGCDAKNHEPMQRKQRRAEPRRKAGGSHSGGGMQCRRNKHFSWGSGQGARLADLRAFASGLVILLCGMVASASAVTFDMTEIGNPGNANALSGLGAVNTTFRISTYETNNTQFAEFLNTSTIGKSNQYSIYDANMGSNAQNGGITQSGSAGSYSYAVKSGFEDKPVTWVNWFTAARFVNWYANGGKDVSSTETGSYTLDGKTTGDIVARNAGATAFLPNTNEWTKAAYYTAGTSTYTVWPTGQDTKPTGTVTDMTGNNVANFGVIGNVQQVGSYANTTSSYGLFDMLGNVNEMTDNQGTGANAGKYAAMGGGWGNSTTNINAFTSNLAPVDGSYRLGTAASSSLGFRVATVAVPEPSTYALAGMGMLGMMGMHLAKRRRLAAVPMIVGC